LKGMNVLLADEHGLVRAGLRSLLESLGTNVIGEAPDGREALRLIGKLRPAVALIHAALPLLNGIEIARHASKQHPQTRVLLLSRSPDGDYVRQAFSAGAAGYLLKSADKRELGMALQAISRGDVWLSPSVSRAFITELLRPGDTPPSSKPASAEPPIQRLTPRQREVLQLVAEGHSTKAIAKRLEISVKTVETHRAEIMVRLNVHNIVGLVHWAIRTGMVPPNL
jgi:two-component system, NarL family, response regulator LiaR